MHDWSLVTILLEWAEGKITITMKNGDSREVHLVASGLAEIKVPKREEWGGSVSINKVDGPSTLANGNSYLSIEVQSGDKIELEAESISLPIT